MWTQTLAIPFKEDPIMIATILLNVAIDKIKRSKELLRIILKESIYIYCWIRWGNRLNFNPLLLGIRKL